jgi:hypothetical protein
MYMPPNSVASQVNINQRESGKEIQQTDVCVFDFLLMQLAGGPQSKFFLAMRILPVGYPTQECKLDDKTICAVEIGMNSV